MIFLDGIGLGGDNPATNPFAAAHTPTLYTLANGKRWLRDTGQQVSERALFKPLDAQMGIPGKPQSGTNQAAILTGINVPQRIGRHYGPKPDADTRAIVAEDNFFMQVLRHSKRAALINAYPPHLRAEIARGKVLRTSIQQAAHNAGLPMFTEKELYSGDALSEDFTGIGWRTHLKFSDTPLYSPQEAGRRMVELSRRYEFAFFSHWLTDIIGHRGTIEEAITHLETLDQVMEGAMTAWDDREGLMLIVSDHGNFEEMHHGKHTENEVPAVVIGHEKARFAEGLTDLAGLVPRMADLLLTPRA